MPRDLPLGNGRLLYAFDQRYRLRDAYYPHVGVENHCGGVPSRLGVFVDGAFSWVDTDEWRITLRYADRTLVGDTLLECDRLQVALHVADCVDFHETAYLRRLTVEDRSGRARSVRLFAHHEFQLGGTTVGDTAYFEPVSGTVVHYKSFRYVLCGAMRPTSTASGPALQAGLDGFATGQIGVGGTEGTWRDAEDGVLSGNPIAQGSVDSVIQVNLTVPASGTATAYTWDAWGDSIHDVHVLQSVILDRGPETLIERTQAYWRLWCARAVRGEELLDPAVADMVRRSLLVLRTQVDDGGAIIAANDTDIAAFSRDTYSYMWPRDGALTAEALTVSGLQALSRRFFEFCARVVREEGYFLHKYSPDGALASSWHPWFRDGGRQLPIQEDETALVVWALWHFFDHTHNVEAVKPLYRPLVTATADFMCDYRDHDTGLPLPSWDLWEERRGVHAFTVGAVWAGLRAAGDFAEAFGEQERATRYRDTAASIRDAAEAHLFDQGLGRFVRTVELGSDGSVRRDPVLDASLHGLFRFGMLEASDPRVVATMEAVRDRLWVRTDVGGCARYEDDYYHQVSNDTDRVPGNPWFVCTLWLADWEIARATTADELDRALPYVEWVVKRALPSGVLPEQVNPLDDSPLSVSPLTWSHAALVRTVNAYLERRADMDRCDECGRPMPLTRPAALRTPSAATAG